MSGEVQQYKESISDRYIADFKKELNFVEKAMLLPIEKKMKEILKSDKKIDVSNLRDLEDLWFWRKVLGFKIWNKHLFESLMTKTFNFLKEKQEKIIEAEAAWRLQELTSLVINGKLDELDTLVTNNSNPAISNDNSNLNWWETVETPGNWSQNGANPWNNSNPSWNESQVNQDWWENGHSLREFTQDNAAWTSTALGAWSAVTFGASMNTLSKMGTKWWREALQGVQLSEESARGLMNQNIKLLESQKRNPKLWKFQTKQIDKTIEEFKSAKNAINGKTIEAVKIRETFGDRLPSSMIKNLKISPKTAEFLSGLNEAQFNKLKNTKDIADFKNVLKGMNKEIEISDDAVKMLRVAKDFKEFKWITTIFKELKWLRQFVKCMKWTCLLSFAFLWFDIWAFIETGKEADMIKEFNKERGMYKQQRANAQLGIGIAWVVADILITVWAYVWIGACCWPWWAVAWLVVWVVQMLATFALESYYAKEEFYAQNRIDFSTRSRTYVKQSIVQLLESDRRDFNEGMKAEVRELRWPDSDADTLEDAWEALIFQEECEVGWYDKIQQYYSSGKSEENFLKELSEEDKNDYNEQKQELEWIIKVRMDYIKKYIKEDRSSPEYLYMKRKLESNQWISYVEQVLADSKVYATLQWEIDNPYVENYKTLDVAWYKEAYKAKLQSEYPNEFALFENLSSQHPEQLNEICSWVSVLKNYISDITEWEVTSEFNFSQTELNNMKRNVEFVERYDEYSKLGKPVESQLLLVSMDSAVDFAYVEQVLADNFASINKRRSWDKETTLNYMYWSVYRNRLEARYDVSDSLTENILYSIAREFHGYTWRNETIELINFYNEWDKNSLWIYYDDCRRFNLDWWHDAEITADFSSLDNMPTEKILKIFNRWELDSDAEAADTAVNDEYKRRIQEIIIRETNYRKNKWEYEQQILDFVRSNSIDGGYVELPYDLVIAAKKAGIWKVENYLFKMQDGAICAISCWDTVDDVLRFDSIGQQIKYEATTPLRDTLTKEELDLIKSVDVVSDKLATIRSVEMDFYHDHTDELDIPVQLERLMSQKKQEWEKEKDMLYYMEPMLAKDYLKRKAKEYYDYFDWIYRWILTTITSYKNGNDMNTINDFNSALRRTSQYNIVSLNEKWVFIFDESIPEQIASVLPKLFDYYKDPTSWKTVSELLRSKEDDWKTRWRWQFLAKQIYTVFLEESVLYYKNWNLNDFHVDWERNFDLDKIKTVLNDKMKVYTFLDTYQEIDTMDCENITLNEKSIRNVDKAENKFHNCVEWVTNNIVKTMKLTDWAWFRGDPTFETEQEQQENWKIKWVLNSWWSSEPITINTWDWWTITSLRVDWINMDFNDIEEWFRVSNLINWIKKNKKDHPNWQTASNRVWWRYEEYFRNNWQLDRNITGTLNNLIILEYNTVITKYPSIKNNKEFIDYINSSNV